MCVCKTIGVSSIFRFIRKTDTLVRILSHFDLYHTKFIIRCDERLKPKPRNLHVSHTLGSTGNWNTQTRLIDEKFPSVMGMCF